VTKKIEAMAAKEEGNKAFGAKQYEEAVKHFCRAVELDPRWGWAAGGCRAVDACSREHSVFWHVADPFEYGLKHRSNHQRPPPPD